MKRIREIRDFLKSDIETKTEATLTKEDAEILIKILNEYILFHDSSFMPNCEKMFSEIEKALGFKLFTWQKVFIVNGFYRRTGETTAQILQQLLRYDAAPIDYSYPATNAKEHCFRSDFKKIQVQLQQAGITTRKVFWNKREKQKYMNDIQNKDSNVITGKKPLWVLHDESDDKQ